MKNFDGQLCEMIRKQFDESKALELTSAYSSARSKLENEVYPNIQGREPNLSDHGIRHISNVQQNIIQLLSNNGAIADLTGIEMYCLGMLILLHDAGNVYGRANHHKKVGRVFDQIRGTASSIRHEKTLLVKAARAHTGTSQDGSHDTLKEVEEIEQLGGERVRLRELAALLRFADELAEGPQRTSNFMQKENLYSEESKIYHRYASSTNILIDREAGRIAVAYEIDVDMVENGEERKKNLSEFLNFVYGRLLKLNQERQYARYYTILLAPFRSTEATFNFHCGDGLLNIDLLPLILTDIVIPGESTKSIENRNPDYNIQHLVTDVLSKCPRSEP